MEEKGADETSLVQHHSEVGRKTNPASGEDPVFDHGASGYWLHRGNIYCSDMWVALNRLKSVYLQAHMEQLFKKKKKKRGGGGAIMCICPKYALLF